MEGSTSKKYVQIKPNEEGCEKLGSPPDKVTIQWAIGTKKIFFKKTLDDAKLRWKG